MNKVTTESEAETAIPADEITSRDMPAQHRRAAVEPGSIDEEARTVEIVWTTGARVSRMSFWSGKRYEEELSLDAKHVDLSRLNNGAPLLDTHNTYGLGGVVGVVEKAWIKGGEGRAIVRFSGREDIEPIWQDVRTGIIRNVSVGYQVRKYEITKEEGKPDLYRAVDWQPMELSMVPVGADADAGTRSADDGKTMPCEFITNRATAHNQETVMKKDDKKNETVTDEVTATRTTDSGNGTAAETETAPAGETVEADALRAEGQAAERTRQAEIRQAGEALNIDADKVEKLIADGVAADAARSTMIDDHAERAAAGNSISGQTVVVSGDHDERAFMRQHVEDALLHRFQPGTYELSEGGRQYRGLSLIEIGRESLQLAGVSTRGMAPAQVAAMVLGQHTDGTRAGYMGTTDFPNILANTANKVLLAAFAATGQTFRAFCRQATAKDFKTKTLNRLGEAPSLEKVNAGGEFKTGNLSEKKESYALATYGKIIAINRQTIINDDLDAFTKLPMMYGIAAANLESDTVWAIITTNGVMADGVALFHATHKNLAGTGTAISVTSLGVGRAAMRKQTGVDGKTTISVSPNYLIVPAEKETLAEQFVMTNLQATKGADINPFAGKLKVIPEARLDDDSTTSWYLAVDPSQQAVETIEYAYLEGQEGVYLESRLGFEVDGMELKARLDFAASAVDHQGLYKNPGA